MATEEDAAALSLDPDLQARAEAELNEPATLEAKCERVAALRSLIAALPSAEDRLQDVSARNLVRFLRASKYRMERAVERAKDYARFFAQNRELDNLRPAEEFASSFAAAVQVWHNLHPSLEGRVVVCIFPGRALPLITQETVKASPRILLRFNVWLFDRLSFDQRIQVCGLVLLNTFADAGLPRGRVSLGDLANVQERRMAFKFFGILSLRLHRALIFEEPALLSFIWWVVKAFVSSKIRQRFVLNGRNYGAVDAVLGSEARALLDEPFRSLGAAGGASVHPPAEASWMRSQLSLPQ